MSYKKHKQYRLLGYDYSQNGAYFITIVTKNRIPFFGEIKENVMTLSPIGKFIENNFVVINEKVNYIQIDEYAIMPNHLHLIITIDKIIEHTSINMNLEQQSFLQLRPLQKQSISAFINHLKGK